MPSFDVNGSTGAVVLIHIGATAVNVGVSFTVTDTVAVPLNVLVQPAPVMLVSTIVWFVVTLFNGTFALPPVSTAV
jgi:hypothetical protein